MKNSFRLVPFLICLAVPLVPGFIVGMLTSGSADIYERIKTPVFAPPAAVFPIAWGILYALMGISLYLIYRSGGVRRNYVLFGVQLLINLVWPFLFFTFEAFTAAFFWLLLLWAAILAMIISFYGKYPPSAYLQIPYLLGDVRRGAEPFGCTAERVKQPQKHEERLIVPPPSTMSPS